MTKTVLCMNPGPIEFEPRVLKPFAMEGISHVDKTVIEVFGQCLEKMRKVFLAPDGQPLIVAGSGTLGWDMVGANLVNKGDDVLIVNNGYFGDNFGQCLECYGASTTHVRGEIGSQASIMELEAVLQRGVNFKVVTITHVDTSTGVCAHVEEVAAAIRRIQPNAVIVLDGVCATGGEVTRMKQWDIDVVLTGSQKCIGVPAGLSLMVIRPRALQLFENNTSTVKYYVDWRNWLPIMKNYEARQPSYFATPSVNHLFALNEALDILLENGGMEQRFREHKFIGDAVKEAMTTLGCSLVTVDGCGASTLTCVRYPIGVGAADFLPKAVKRGVSLAGGLHKAIKTEYFRIGHMGPSTRRLDHILKTVDAIEGALIECGHKVAQPGKAGNDLKKKLKPFIPLRPVRDQSSVFHGCPVPPMCRVYSISAVVVAFTAGLLISQVKRAH
uniref:alanine--glyoxylate transaminase n=1 Tax=Hyaloperonospora arabidopsidis (strain Emoy2) TaxID=559515 RepID=M4BPY4_HYAAE